MQSFKEYFYQTFLERSDIKHVRNAQSWVMDKINHIKTGITKLANRVAKYHPEKITHDEKMDMRHDIQNIFNYILSPIVFKKVTSETKGEYEPQYHWIYVHDNNATMHLSELERLMKIFIERSDKFDIRQIKENGGINSIKKKIQHHLENFLSAIDKEHIRSTIYHEYIHSKQDEFFRGTTSLKQAYNRGAKQQDRKQQILDFYKKQIKLNNMTVDDAEKEANKRISHLINSEYYNDSGETNAYILQAFNDLSNDESIKNFQQFLNKLQTRLETNLKYFNSSNKRKLVKRAYEFYTSYVQSTNT